MRRPTRLAALAVGLTTGLLLAWPGTASATGTSSPHLTVVPHALFLQGGIISPSAAPTPDQETFVDSIPMYITWKGSDADGICGYDVKADYAGDFPQTLVSGTHATRYQGTATDYDDQYGGGSQKIEGWIVVAHDCAGHTTSRESVLYPTVTQENGHSPADGGVVPTIAYSGTWSGATCSCWSAGAVRWTTQHGAAATITLDTTSPRMAVGLVMEKAPNRGKFTLLVDGVSKGTVDTRAGTATHRVIVWSGTLATAGHHVVRVVNQATAGRPRIDLDAVLVN